VSLELLDLNVHATRVLHANASGYSPCLYQGGLALRKMHLEWLLRTRRASPNSLQSQTQGYPARSSTNHEEEGGCINEEAHHLPYGDKV
jgi:hypothetical protein